MELWGRGYDVQLDETAIICGKYPGPWSLLSAVTPEQNFCCLWNFADTKCPRSRNLVRLGIRDSLKLSLSLLAAAF